MTTTEAGTTDAPTGSGPTPPDRRAWLRVGLVLVAVGIVVTTVVLLTRPEPPLPGIARDPALDAAGLEFVDFADDDGGVVVDLVPDDGEVTLAYFGYLSCPDVCPTTMVDIAAAIRQLPADRAERVTVAFVTVDPERDTGPELRDYLGVFYDGLRNDRAALRADAATPLEEAADRLQVFYEIAEHEPGAERYDVGHSAITYVVDDTGTVVREMPFGATAEEFARVITHTLDG